MTGIENDDSSGDASHFCYVCVFASTFILSLGFHAGLSFSKGHGIWPLSLGSYMSQSRMKRTARKISCFFCSMPSAV